MDILQESRDGNKKNFFNHVFATTEEHNAEILNGFQYAIVGVIPIVILNKLIQRFLPDADAEKTSVEILIEVFIQLLAMIGGVIIIHRSITFVPTYSGFKYENFAITNVILLFLVIILSIQTKVGVKVNILFDRINDLWNGENYEVKSNVKKRVKFNDNSYPTQHQSSQGDYLDDGGIISSGGFPPAPVVQSRGNGGQEGYNNMIRTGGGGDGNEYGGMSQGPAPANSLIGSSFNLF